MRKIASLLVLVGLLALPAGATPKSERKGEPTVWIGTQDGQSMEGTLSRPTLKVLVEGKERELALIGLLSLHSGAVASASEQKQIADSLEALTGNDRSKHDVAVATLTDLGLPVITPLLATYKDTDLHEPNPLYRLFARLIPGYADGLDRTLDLIRLANGEVFRGKLLPAELQLTTSDGKAVTVSASNVRRIAVQQRAITRTFEVQALRHCVQIEFLDTGVSLSSASQVKENAEGYVRLAFAIDGWTSDPDGIKKPGPNYNTIYTEGFPFGALVGRIGPKGARWLAGRHFKKEGLDSGRLYFAVNDNPHWQNNLGSFRVKLRVTNAYDLGEAQ